MQNLTPTQNTTKHLSATLQFSTRNSALPELCHTRLEKFFQAVPLVPVINQSGCQVIAEKAWPAAQLTTMQLEVKATYGGIASANLDSEMRSIDCNSNPTGNWDRLLADSGLFALDNRPQ